MPKLGINIRKITYSRKIDDAIRLVSIKLSDFVTLKNHHITSGHLFTESTKPIDKLKLTERDKRRYLKIKKSVEIPDHKDRHRLERFRLSMKYGLDPSIYSSSSDSDTD